MKRLSALLTLVLCLSAPVFARQKIQGYCEQGGKTVTTSGLTSTTKVQQSFPSCTITIYLASTVTPATVYGDNAGTPKSNPLTADSTGYWFAYADNGRYDVRQSGGGIASPFTLGDYLLDDNAEMTLTLNAMAFNATPTFDASIYSSFSMTLTGNIASSVVTNAKAGRIIALSLCQDGTGTRTVSWPPTFDSAPVPDARASKCLSTTWFYNGSRWKMIGQGGDSLGLPASSVITNGSAVLTLPTATDTLVGRATTDTLTNKTLSGGTLSGAITNSATVTGGTFSGYTMAGAITGTGSTTTGGTLSGATIANPTLTGTVAGTPTFSGAVTLSSTLSVAGQITSTLASGTAPMAITSVTPVANLTPQRLNSTTVVNTANVDTLTFTNPAAPRALTIPDLGRDANFLLTGTAGTIDCDTTDATCNINDYVSMEAANCTSSTVAVTEWNIISSVVAVPTCFSGTNQSFGTLWLPASINAVQQQVGNNAAGAGTVTTTYSAAVGSLLIAATASDGNQTVTGCTDGTNAYTLAVRSNNVGNDTTEIWYKQNATAVSGVTLTCTFSGSVKGALNFWEFTGANAVALDVTAAGTGNDTAPTTVNTGVPAVSPDLVFTSVAAKNTPAVTETASAFIMGATANATTSPTVASAGKIIQSATAQTGSFTLGTIQQWAAAVAVFKPAVTGTDYIRIGRPIKLPAVYSNSGTLDITINWRNRLANAATAKALLGAVVSCVAADGSWDSALNTESTSAGTVSTVAGAVNTLTISGVDTTGCVAGSQMLLQVFRKRGSGNDTSILPVELVSVERKFRNSN